MKFDMTCALMAIAFFAAGFALAVFSLSYAGAGCLTAGAALLALGYEGKK